MWEIVSSVKFRLTFNWPLSELLSGCSDLHVVVNVLLTLQHGLVDLVTVWALSEDHLGKDSLQIVATQICEQDRKTLSLPVDFEHELIDVQIVFLGRDWKVKRVLMESYEA